MASILRPSVLRQTCLGVVSKRAFSNKISSSFSTAAIKSTPSMFWRQAVRHNLMKESYGCNSVAAFHTGGRQAILPPGPQVIDGTANDAAKIPPSNPSHGSYHWTFERLVSAGLIPLTIAPFAAGSLNPMTDAILCGCVIIHSHIGFDAMITDYFPPRQVPKTRKVLDWVLRLATISVGVALYEFETNDVGVTEAIKRIWKA